MPVTHPLQCCVAKCHSEYDMDHYSLHYDSFMSSFMDLCSCRCIMCPIPYKSLSSLAPQCAPEPPHKPGSTQWVDLVNLLAAVRETEVGSPVRVKSTSGCDLELYLTFWYVCLAHEFFVVAFFQFSCVHNHSLLVCRLLESYVGDPMQRPLRRASTHFY